MAGRASLAATTPAGSPIAKPVPSRISCSPMHERSSGLRRTPTAARAASSKARRRPSLRCRNVPTRSIYESGLSPGAVE